MSSIQERDHQYIAGTYARFPVTIVSGKGSIAVDENGKEYIDMGTGIGVDAFGYGDEQWLNAVETQLHKIQHTSNLYYTEPAVELAQLLCEKTGMSKAQFKRAVGKLLKDGNIDIWPDRIELRKD